MGAEVQKVFAAAKKGEWQRVSENQVEVAGHLLESSEFDLMLEPTDPTTTASLKANDAVVILDTEVTPELEAEGSARDLIRLIQQSRKDADLEVTDRISLKLNGRQRTSSKLSLTKLRSSQQFWQITSNGYLAI